jgi:hypothetical protein
MAGVSQRHRYRTRRSSCTPQHSESPTTVRSPQTCRAASLNSNRQAHPGLAEKMFGLALESSHGHPRRSVSPRLHLARQRYRRAGAFGDPAGSPTPSWTCAQTAPDHPNRVHRHESQHLHRFNAVRPTTRTPRHPDPRRDRRVRRRRNAWPAPATRFVARWMRFWNHATAIGVALRHRPPDGRGESTIETGCCEPWA